MVSEVSVRGLGLSVRASGRSMGTLLWVRDRHWWAWKRVWAGSHALSFFNTNRSNKRRRGASTTASPSDEDVSMNGRETFIVSTDSVIPFDVRTTATIL